ncbi:signal peptide peptidase-domain-containing protein [Fomes fomentarius]|nr:signal peptide peptidase-domain-containing protein [Fomes fomentarius]
MSTSGTDWDLFSSYAGLLSLACVSIYAGSHGSLSSRSTRPPGTEAEEEEEEEVDRLSSQDAYLFPVIGSAVLFGLYLIVKYYGKEWITWLLQWYFTIAGVGSVGKSLISLSRWIVGEARWIVGEARWREFDKLQLLLLKGPRGNVFPLLAIPALIPAVYLEYLSVSLRTPSLFLIPAGSIPSVLYTFGGSATRRSALLTDVLALSFSHNALSLLKLDSFKTGCVLLSGLFLYDIWWVFGTEVMVKVATTLDVPIKLLWPKSLTFATERGFTMLGLGDIVIPGMFVATALRYDYHRAARQGSTALVTKTYFYTALSAYATGLVVTMSVMHFFRKAQPALLYLSPACIMSFFVVSFARGEFKEAWSWSDDVEEKSDKSASQTEANRNGKTDDAPVPPPKDIDVVEDAPEEKSTSVQEDQDSETTEKKKRSKKKRN